MLFGDRQHRILRFWRDIEAFTPQEVACLQDGHRLAVPTYGEHEGQQWALTPREVSLRLGGSSTSLPWSTHTQAEEYRLKPNLVDHPWRGHRVYLGLIEAAAVSSAILRLAPMQGVGGPSEDIARVNFEEKWRGNGRYALMALELDSQGCLRNDPGNVFISSLLLGLEALSTGRFPPGGLRLNDKLATERQGVLDRWLDRGSDFSHPIEQGFLEAEAARLIARLSSIAPDGWCPYVTIQSSPRHWGGIDATTGDESLSEPINSFYFDPLHELVQALDPTQRAPGHSLELPSAPLASFLADTIPDESREDWLTTPSAFAAALSPARLPLGAWPSRDHLMADHAAAVSEVIHRLHKEGLAAVNAPPGTGKSTLVQDLIAHVVIQRADRLASKEEAGDWLTQIPVPGAPPVCMPALDLLRDGLIVLASGNHSVVEILAHELPRAHKINDRYWRYLAPLSKAWEEGHAVAFHHEPVWGPIALALGKASNQVAGRDRLIFGEPANENHPLRPGLAHLLRKDVAWAAPDWASARERYLVARARVTDARAAIIQSIHQGRALHAAWKDRPQVEAQYAQAAESLAVWGTLEDQLQSPVGRTHEEAVEQLDLLEAALEAAKYREQVAQTDVKHHAAVHHVSGVARAWDRAFGSGHSSLRHRIEKGNAAAAELIRAKEEVQQLAAELTQARAHADHATRDWNKVISKWSRQYQRRQTAMLVLQEQLGNLQIEIEELESQVDPAVRGEVARWSHSLATHRNNHASHPWTPEDWPEAQVWLGLRKELFYCALELHEAALYAWRDQIKAAMLYHLPRLLTRPLDVPAVLRAPLWNLLGFVCPVVTASLASFPRQFAGLRPGALGWLVVDEAGQAPPSAVAWALQRSKRAVIMGDPRQLEPVVNLSPSLIDRLVEAHQAEPRHRPDRTSAQTLADQTMRQGAWIESSTEGRETRLWTGLPLRAHRRCQSPMFDIANSIAYADQMTQATPEGHICRDGRLMSSFWWDISNDGVQGHHQVIEEELRALSEFLQAWKVNPPTCGPTGTEREASLFVISPFRAVAEAARGQIAFLGLAGTVRAGTVHSFQGQVADSVVLVLGTPSGKAGAGARQWASQTPNLLNVAITRARQQLVVIGSRPDWQSRPFFDTLARQLPSRLDKTSLQP